MKLLLHSCQQLWNVFCSVHDEGRDPNSKQVEIEKTLVVCLLATSLWSWWRREGLLPRKATLAATLPLVDRLWHAAARLSTSHSIVRICADSTTDVAVVGEEGREESIARGISCMRRRCSSLLLLLLLDHPCRPSRCEAAASDDDDDAQLAGR